MRIVSHDCRVYGRDSACISVPPGSSGTVPLADQWRWCRRSPHPSSWSSERARLRPASCTRSACMSTGKRGLAGSSRRSAANCPIAVLYSSTARPASRFCCSRRLMSPRRRCALRHFLAVFLGCSASVSGESVSGTSAKPVRAASFETLLHFGDLRRPVAAPNRRRRPAAACRPRR